MAKRAEDDTQVKIALLVEHTANKVDCIAALKNASVNIADFKKDIEQRASLLLTTLEEHYWKILDAQNSQGSWKISPAERGRVRVGHESVAAQGVCRFG